jgi:hypothetical protein
MRTLRRMPANYFALLRLPVVYYRIAGDPRLCGGSPLLFE